MQLSVHFRDIGRTEALENFLYDRVEAATEGFLKYDPDSSLTVRIESERHRTENRKPSFVCEITLKLNRQKGTLKVRKCGGDFHAAVNDAAAALKTILRRRSTRKSQHRRHEHSRELEEFMVAVS